MPISQCLVDIRLKALINTSCIVSASVTGTLVPVTEAVLDTNLCGKRVILILLCVMLSCVSCRGPSALDHLAAKLTVSMMTFADTAAATFGEGASNAAASAGAAVQSATDAAADTITKKDNGWFGFLTGPLETVLKVRSWQTSLSSGLQHGPVCRHVVSRDTLERAVQVEQCLVRPCQVGRLRCTQEAPFV